MISEKDVEAYCDEYEAQMGVSRSDIRFALRLVYLSLDITPAKARQIVPLASIHDSLRLREYEWRNGVRILLEYLCSGWLERRQAAVGSWQELRFSDLLSIIATWRSHFGFANDWETIDWRDLARIATLDMLDDNFVEIGKRYGFLPNAQGGLRLAWDYPRDQRLNRALHATALLQLARREMLSPKEYGLRFHPDVDAAVLGCVLETIASYSGAVITQEVIRPVDELYNSWEADDIWLDLSRSLPKRTGYRFQRRFRQLNGSHEDPSSDSLSVFRFVRLVFCNLDMHRPNYAGDEL